MSSLPLFASNLVALQCPVSYQHCPAYTLVTFRLCARYVTLRIGLGPPPSDTTNCSLEHISLLALC